jgi:hypothetical protein
MSNYARIRHPLPIPPMRVSPVQFSFGKQLEIMHNEYNCTYSILYFYFLGGEILEGYVFFMLLLSIFKILP